MDQAQMTGIAIGLGGLAVLALIVFIKNNMIICQPNEIVILSGRKRTQPDGSVAGYRVIRGGRGFKWPFIESVARLPLTTLPIEVHLPKALCAGMIPVSIEGRANVKLAGRPEEGLESAVERFLGKGADAVTRTAQQTIEGALRGVIATVSPEEANAQRLQLAKDVTSQAREDLGRLGIVLDFFQIQSIADDQGYLEAIGRRKNAEVRRDAKIAEAQADAEARQVSAEQRRIGREAEVEAERSIIKRENALAVERAELATESNRAEERSKVAGDIARTEERIALESKKVELSGKKQEAETIIPARAAREAKVLHAEGNAARILEDGKATAQAIGLMREQWQDGDTHDLFLIQLLPELLDKVTSVVSDNLRIDKLTILDGGDGKGLPSYVNNITGSAVAMLEQLKNATGIDIEKLAQRGTSDTSAQVPKELG
jgi:flotillin